MTAPVILRCHARGEVHPPSEICAPWHCWAHDVDERRSLAYRVCFECRHRYLTRWHVAWSYLRTDWRVTRGHRSLWTRVRRLSTVLRPSRIPFCPECLHDF